MTMTQRDPSLPLALAGFLLFACQPQAPVARLQTEPATLSLAYPQTATVDLTWQPLEPVAADGLHVFVHLLDSAGEVKRTFDHPLPGGWTIGQEVAYPLALYQSALDPPLAAGTYDLALGLYEASGRRWPLATDGAEVDEHEYVVAQVEVADAARSTPKLTFSGNWATEETGNRQTLIRRRLGQGGGQLVIWGVDQPGEAVLSFQLSEPPATTSSGAVPAVAVGSDCAEVRGEASGLGDHVVRLVIDPAATGDHCTVKLAATVAASTSLEWATWVTAP